MDLLDQSTYSVLLQDILQGIYIGNVLHVLILGILQQKKIRKKSPNWRPTMADNFEQAAEFTKRWEGGYSNDPDDPGGETNFGLSKRFYPDLDLKNITWDEAKRKYLEIWENNRCGKLSLPMDVVAFDCWFNHSPKAVRRFLLNSEGSWERLLLERIDYYKSLVDNSPTLGKFLRGWLNRACALYRYADALEKTEDLDE